MVLLGLLLVILAIAAGVALFVGTQPLTSEIEFEVGVLNFVFTPLQLLIAGAVVMLLLALGLGLIRGALARRRRARQQAKDAQRQAELEEGIRSDERTRAEELHRNELAERERAWEEERAERDRKRDEDFESRRAELEQRIRLDERAKADREIDERHAYSNTRVADEPGLGAGAAGAGAAGGAGAAAGATAAHGYHDGDVHADTGHEPGHHTGHDTAYEAHDAGGSPAADQTQRLPHDGGMADTDGSSGTEADDERDGGSETTGHPERRPVVEPAEPGERTIADRIMGRHPEQRD